MTEHPEHDPPDGSDFEGTVDELMAYVRAAGEQDSTTEDDPRELELESIALDILARHGITLANPRDTGIPLNRTLHQEGMHGDKDYLVSVVCALVGECIVGEHSAFSSEVKKREQLRIVDDELLESPEKAALLDFLDEFYPITGLDITNHSEIAALRAEQAGQDLHVVQRYVLWSTLTELFAEDIAPKYGHHDDLDQLRAAIQGHIAALWRAGMEVGSCTPHEVQADARLQSALDIAEQLGIPAGFVHELIAGILDFFSEEGGD